MSGCSFQQVVLIAAVGLWPHASASGGCVDLPVRNAVLGQQKEERSSRAQRDSFIVQLTEVAARAARQTKTNSPC